MLPLPGLPLTGLKSPEDLTETSYHPAQTYPEALVTPGCALHQQQNL